MSTRSRDTAQALAHAAAQSRFRRLFVTVLLALGLVAAGLAAASVLQGPRLSSAEINPEGAVTLRDQRLLLHANQPIDPVTAKQLTIAPATAASIAVEGASVTVTFAEPLRYNTEYSVTVDGVRGASTGATGALSYSFNTPDADFYTVNRATTTAQGGQAAPDSILRHTISGSISNEVMFEAPSIQGYAVLESELVVVTLGDDQAPELVIRSLTDDRSAPLYAGDPARIRNLHSSVAANMFGFIAEGSSSPGGREYDNTLLLYDRANTSVIPLEITGPGGAPLAVADWAFVPGTTSIVVQDREQQLYLIETLGGGEPTPLGQHAELRGFIPGTVTLVVADPDGGSLIDLAAGTTAPLELSDPALDPNLYPGKIIMLSEDRYVQLFSDIDYSAGATSIRSVIYRVESSDVLELYRPAAEASRIRNICLSPNGQFLAVDVVAGDASAEGDPEQAASDSVTTAFVDTASGGSTRSVIGSQASWCG